MQKSFEFEGPLRLGVQIPSGEILLENGPDGEAEVELVGHDEESRALVEEARVELVGNELIVDVPSRKKWGISITFGRSGITCRVRCPQGTGVSARTRSADVEGRGRFGGLNVSTASGDVHFREIGSGANVKTASGDISLETVAGAVSLHSASGDVELGSVGGPAVANTVSGDLTIRDAQDDVNANTVSGDLAIDAVVQGNVNVNSISGDVRVGIRRGSRLYIEANTVSGDTKSELELSDGPVADDGPLVELRAKTVSGDVHIVRAPAPSETPQEVH